MVCHFVYWNKTSTAFNNYCIIIIKHYYFDQVFLNNIFIIYDYRDIFTILEKKCKLHKVGIQQFCKRMVKSWKYALCHKNLYFSWISWQIKIIDYAWKWWPNCIRGQGFLSFSCISVCQTKRYVRYNGSMKCNSHCRNSLSYISKIKQIIVF